jgi:hypothetical protein
MVETLIYDDTCPLERPDADAADADTHVLDYRQRRRNYQKLNSSLATSE